jgi:hypothetical protein
VLKAAFVRTVGERDRVYATRSDGSEVSWAFPSYGGALPHDLVHLVVESAFGVGQGFWGRVDAGAEPAAINAMANRAGGADKYAAFGEDRSELALAEALANARWLAPESTAASLVADITSACAAEGVTPPAGLTAARVDEVRERLRSLTVRWRALAPKGAIDLTFDAGASGPR